MAGFSRRAIRPRRVSCSRPESASARERRGDESIHPRRGQAVRYCRPSRVSPPTSQPRGHSATHAHTFRSLSSGLNINFYFFNCEGHNTTLAPLRESSHLSRTCAWGRPYACDSWEKKCHGRQSHCAEGGCGRRDVSSGRALECRRFKSGVSPDDAANIFFFLFQSLPTPAPTPRLKIQDVYSPRHRRQRLCFVAHFELPCTRLHAQRQMG